MSEQPNSAIARIFTVYGAIAGAGFLISERHLFTCAHVVAVALGVKSDVAEAPEGVITLDFPLVAPNEKLQARVVEWNPLHDKVTGTGTEDVAVLELTESVPPTVQAAPLHEPKNLAEHDWKAFGFPIRYNKGVWAQGKFSGSRVGGWIQLDGSQDRPYSVAQGFSGGPIWDNQQKAIVGMVASVERSEKRRAAFMIPTMLLKQAWPILELKSEPITHRDPYVGLRTFQEEDTEWFFGRRGLTKLLLEKIEQTPFLAVLGPSGSGKSSVVLAGVLPALKRGDLPNSEKWLYLTIKPGARPLDTLATALAKLQQGDLGTLFALRKSFASNERTLLLATDYLLSGKGYARLVLVIDQFEELWTQAPTELEACQAFVLEKQQPFIKQLLTAVQAPSTSLLVILTMRADFLHRAAEHRDLARLIGEHDVIVSPMQDEELRDAIIMPADKAGGRFEAGLVEELIAQTIGRQGALPLLEYTLLELWKSKHADGTMTWDAFRQLGGVEGALAARADTILATHYTPAEQDELRHLLLRLIQPGEGAADTRRRALLDDLVPAGSESESVQLLFQPLVDERLLTTSRDQKNNKKIIEVSHEALIRAWPTLSEWIDDAREDLRFHLQLEEAAKEWQTHEQNSDFLWSGLRLANSEEWLERAQPRLNERDERFLQASRETEVARIAREKAAQREREQLQEARAAAERKAREQAERRAATERSTRQRIARFAMGLAVLFLLTLCIAFYANIKAQEALDAQAVAQEAARLESKARIEAEQQTRIATARQLATEAQTALEASPQRRLLLAVEALQTTTRENEPRVREAEQALRDGLANVGGIGLTGNESPISAVAISPDNHWLVIGNNDNTARLWDLTANEPAASPIVLTGHESPISAVAISPDNHWLVTVSRSLIGYNSTARLWDLTADDPAATPIVLTGHESPISAVAISPDNHWLVTASHDTTARLWDLTADDPAATPIVLTGHENLISAVAISPDNHWLVTASYDNTARLWDLTANDPAATPIVLTGHENFINAVAISLDNHWLVTVSGSLIGYTAHLWDLTADDPAATPIVLTGHENSINAVAISPDNHWLVTASDDRTARLWDLTADDLAATPIVLTGHENYIRDIAISPDNHWLVTGSSDNTARLWDLTANDPAANPIVLTGHEDSISAVAISPDNHWLVTASYDRTARLWDLTGAVPPIVLTGHEDVINDIAISPDSHRLVTVSNDNTARLWDLTTNDSAANPIVLTGHESFISAVAISPDNHWLVTASHNVIGYNSTARLWDLTTNDPAASPIVLNVHESPINVVAISPDNHWLVTGSGSIIGSHDDIARLWDLTADDPAATPIVLTGHEGPIGAVAISPDNHWLVTASGSMMGLDSTARLWNLTANDPAATPIVLTGHEDSVSAVAISPDNHWLVTASSDRTARLWDLTANDPAATPIVLTGHESLISAIAISPDNHWLITASYDSTARLWDLTADDPAASQIVLTGHEDSINAVAISPDNHWLVTASDDRTVRLWDLTANDPAATPIVLGHEDVINAIAISPDNHWLVTASGFKARLWNLRLDELSQLACRTAGRNLSQREWVHYFRGQEYRKICPDLPADYSVVNALVEVGQDLAKSGDIEGAIAKFQEALELEPTLEIDPEVEAQHLVAQTLVERGEKLAREGDLEGAIAKFAEIQAIYPNVEINAKSWNTLCWFGSLWGYAADVIDTCERAVDLAPDNGAIRDSRGLARALTGDYAGAIEDFRFFVEWSKENEEYEEDRVQREAWIAELEAGRNPFDAKTLEWLIFLEKIRTIVS